MKNVIYAVIIIAIAAAIFLYIDKQKEAEGIVAANNIENDYAKIDSVNKAMAKLAKSKYNLNSKYDVFLDKSSYPLSLKKLILSTKESMESKPAFSAKVFPTIL